MGDFRHALRLMRRAPGFTAAALLTLALGVGVNTAVFSLVRAVMLRQSPYHDPERCLHRKREPLARRVAALARHLTGLEVQLFRERAKTLGASARTPVQQ